MRPQAIDELAIGGPFEIRHREHDEQGSRIGAAVVLAERNLAERGHLAVAHFVKNLAGLRVLHV